MTLQDLTDQELSDKIKKEEDILDCINVLRSRHSGIFFQKLNCYSGVSEIEDLKDNNLSFFYEVAKEYDETKSKFNTFLGNKTFYACQGFLKKTRFFSEVSDDLFTELPKTGRKELYRYVIDSITNEENRFIVEKHLEGMTFEEIAAAMGGKYSRQWIREKYLREIERFKTILKDEL